MATLAETAASLGPAKVKIGDEEVTARSVRELREARDDEAAQAAAAANRSGLKFFQFVPPGGG